jgi:hypothetical protein
MAADPFRSAYSLLFAAGVAFVDSLLLAALDVALSDLESLAVELADELDAESFSLFAALLYPLPRL